MAILDKAYPVADLRHRDDPFDFSGSQRAIREFEEDPINQHLEKARARARPSVDGVAPPCYTSGMDQPTTTLPAKPPPQVVSSPPRLGGTTPTSLVGTPAEPPPPVERPRRKKPSKGKPTKAATPADYGIARRVVVTGDAFDLGPPDGVLVAPRDGGLTLFRRGVDADAVALTTPEVRALRGYIDAYLAALDAAD